MREKRCMSFFDCLGHDLPYIFRKCVNIPRQCEKNEVHCSNYVPRNFNYSSFHTSKYISNDFFDAFLLYNGYMNIEFIIYITIFSCR